MSIFIDTAEFRGTVAEAAFLAQMAEALTEQEHVEEGKDVRSIREFGEAGLLTMNCGLIVCLGDGAEFQITVVQSDGDRTYHDEDDEDES